MRVGETGKDIIRDGNAHPSAQKCVCIRGHFEEYFYVDNGNLTHAIDMVPWGSAEHRSGSIAQLEVLKCVKYWALFR